MKGGQPVARRKYEHRHLITRTISTTSGDVFYFDFNTKDRKIERMTVNGKLSAEQFLKTVKPDGMVLMVENVETTSRLYGMTLETFLANAEEITE